MFFRLWPLLLTACVTTPEWVRIGSTVRESPRVVTGVARAEAEIKSPVLRDRAAENRARAALGRKLDGCLEAADKVHEKRTGQPHTTPRAPGLENITIGRRWAEPDGAVWAEAQLDVKALLEKLTPTPEWLSIFLDVLDRDCD